MATTTLTPTSATTDTPKLLKKSAATPTTPLQSTFGCQHVKALLQAARQPATDGYSRIFQTLQREDGCGGRTYKSSNGGSTTIGTTYLCLQCPTVSSSRERHKKDHAFAVESDNGFIFCHDCRDFVYDPTFEALRTSSSTKKRKHSHLPSEERKLVSANTATTPCSATGLRGLYNMGQTCFMSVVLQSLIHNPLIRSWYLSEGHKSSDCEREACTACALDDIFTDFYGVEKHEGYGAVHMLQGCWKGGGNLAGYSQQDAHEYLGFILNSLHTAFIEDEDDDDDASIARMKKEKDTKDCECAIHQTFSGLLRSTVTCTKCRNTTTAVESFLDLSLDIRSTSVSVKKKKLALTNGTQTIKEVLPMDLSECLDRFTSAETLSSDSYHCTKCDQNREAKKKLSLRCLPPVVPIHLKRFSHSKTLAQSSKVDTKIRFPLTFDFTPYLGRASTDAKSKGLINGHKAAAVKGEDDDADADGDDDDDDAPKAREPDPEPLEPVYELSSVVVHKGKIDNGHYVSYCRQGEHEWFRFDDSMVVQVDEKEVLSAEAYMLFYVARGFGI
ncbi:hypothetical protein LTS14_002460 [Recurvomyces mirabilis]|uniref:uncharacterized protein n=1 Tax=Recurvomyces mirabilis TaxID=574656 RepID=UPI002DDEC022|nr:hypothetical protein LTS14_002460 [Recurvomyces mirabilis]